MKKLLIIVLLAGMALSASAQHGYHGGVHYVPRYYAPRVGVGIGFGFGYPYYGLGYPYYGYPYPAYGYGYSARPSKLALEIDDIRNDYKARIWAVKHDHKLSHHERRLQVRQLKADRDKEINEAKRRYYRY